MKEASLEQMDRAEHPRLAPVETRHWQETIAALRQALDDSARTKVETARKTAAHTPRRNEEFIREPLCNLTGSPSVIWSAETGSVRINRDELPAPRYGRVRRPSPN